MLPNLRIALHSFHSPDPSLLLHNIQRVNTLPFISRCYQTFTSPCIHFIYQIHRCFYTTYKGLIPLLFSVYVSKPLHIALHSFHLPDPLLLLHHIQLRENLIAKGKSVFSWWRRMSNQITLRRRGHHLESKLTICVISESSCTDTVMTVMIIIMNGVVS